MVYARVDGFPPNGTQTLNFSDKGNTMVVDGTVPIGKHLLITYISLSPDSLLDIDNEFPIYSILLRFGAAHQNVRGKYVGGNIFISAAGYAPPGELERVKVFR